MLETDTTFSTPELVTICPRHPLWSLSSASLSCPAYTFHTFQLCDKAQTPAMRLGSTVSGLPNREFKLCANGGHRPTLAMSILPSRSIYETSFLLVCSLPRNDLSSVALTMASKAPDTTEDRLSPASSGMRAWTDQGIISTNICAQIPASPSAKDSLQITMCQCRWRWNMKIINTIQGA